MPMSYVRRFRVMLAAGVLLAALVTAGVNSAVAGPVLYQDGFESGLSSWTTVQGIVTQNVDVVAGAHAAQATSTGAAAVARKKLSTSVTSLEYVAKVKLVSQGANPVVLLAVSPATGSALASVLVNAKGRLALQAGGATTVSTVPVTRDVWHTVRLQVELGAEQSRADVWWDGSASPVLHTSRFLGTTPVSRLQIGDGALRRSFTVRFDDVAAHELSTIVDNEPPTAPIGVTAVAGSARWVDVAWEPATDNVGVSGYDVLRDGVQIASVGPVTSYADAGVTPDTTYSYEVRARDAAGNTGMSSGANATTPLAGDSAVVAAAGDIACPPTALVTPTTCQQRATSDLVLGIRPDRVLTLGDNQYEKGSLADYRGGYDPSWGRFRSITSPVPGNHEYLTTGAAGYYSYFGSAAGDPTKGYYSFDIGDWHVIALNSNCAALGPVDGCAEGTPQNDWLEADLASHANACTLAYWHHPLLSSGAYGGVAAVKPFWDDLYAADADLVLVGHSHNYERFAPMTPDKLADSSRGIRQFVVGSGGKNHATGRIEPAAISEIRSADTFGVLELTLAATGYDWRFVTEAGAAFADVGSDACH